MCFLTNNYIHYIRNTCGQSEGDVCLDRKHAEGACVLPAGVTRASVGNDHSDQPARFLGIMRGKGAGSCVHMQTPVCESACVCISLCMRVYVCVCMYACVCMRGRERVSKSTRMSSVYIIIIACIRPAVQDIPNHSGMLHI